MTKRKEGSDMWNRSGLIPPWLRSCTREIEACPRREEGDVGGVYPRRKQAFPCNVLRRGTPCPFVIRQFPT